MTEHDYLDKLIEPLLSRIEKAVREIEEVGKIKKIYDNIAAYLPRRGI